MRSRIMHAYTIMIAALFCAGMSYANPQNEIRVGGIYLSPSGDLWEPGGGASVEWRRLIKDNFSVSLSIGIMKLDASTDEIPGDEGAVVTGGSTGIYYGFVDYYEGEATIIPVSSFLIYDIPLGTATLSLEGGFKYIFVNSDVEAHMLDGFIDPYTGQAFGSDRWISETEIGGNLLGALAAHVAFPLNDKAKIFIGGGYQIDIVKSDVELKNQYSDYDGKSVTENELAGFFVEAGVGFGF